MRKQGVADVSFCTFFSKNAIRKSAKTDCGKVGYIDCRPFTFTGKERDEETGYGYFGARYMDHELTTMWLSVDPMSDKYPSISPYAYCAWNPVKLVDPDGNDWYETDKGNIKWTDCHSQKEMKSNGINGDYLGVTVKNGNKYYSLFGKECNLNSQLGKLTQALDNAIINHVRAIRKGTDVEKVPYENFSDIYPFEPGVGGHNTHQGEEYAGGRVAVFVNATNMKGRLESLTSTNKPLGGPFALKTDRVSGHRFNIRNNSENYNIIATIYFDQKVKADGFASKISDMMNKSIYPTLKQVERVNGRYQQKVSW